ncbi:hypothetical protein TGAM01_v209502 [Trichoderma gamsii]|uniref:Uncharacterized protein n=1 Tax=Trichoderma gamsii TaxID=398673 RepID=A0A2P4ZBD9_9HYPO|nr:hypothetical protein TGAM01_v209502 [Trichoderma gamsii]PON21613.1 hypothetical protein TGAM01_v209502 [Trichoderma gamsii]
MPAASPLSHGLLAGPASSLLGCIARTGASSLRLSRTHKQCVVQSSSEPGNIPSLTDRQYLRGTLLIAVHACGYSGSWLCLVIVFGGDSFRPGLGTG